MIRIVTLVLLATTIASAAEAAALGYVYVPIHPAPCAVASPCAAPRLLVFDPATAAQVIAIDLPVHTTPVGLAISLDGTHLYVSNRGVEFSAGNSVSVIDARHHLLLATVPVTPSGPLAVARDDSRVFILDPTGGLNAFDTSSRTITGSAAVNGYDIAASSSLDRVFVLGTQAMYAFDTSSLAIVMHVNSAYGQRMRASRDGLALFTADLPSFPSHCVGCGTGSIVDALTLAASGHYSFLQDLVVAAEVTAAQLVTFYVGTRTQFDAATGAPIHSAPVSGLGFIAAFDVLPPNTTAAVLHETGSGINPHANTSLAFVDIPSASVMKDTGPFATTPVDADRIVVTPWGAPSCSYRLDQSHAAFAGSGAIQVSSSATARQVRLTTDCAWSVMTRDSWVHVASTGGSGSATIAVTVDVNPSSGNRQTVLSIGGQLLTVTQSGAASAAAFGSFDTPQDFVSSVSGSLAVTGWALDDVGVAAVHIYRDPVPGEPQTLIPIGDATFVDGARPDVRDLYPTLPFASGAGWGYMLLTNMLPGGGTGTYRLHAFIEDVDGHSTFLGTRTFSANNNAATLPFGALDTPAQGETVSGVITNWGWALTPQPATIPVDGSTIDVVIDGVVVGHPTYGLNRADIAAMFPGYANTASAVGYFTIDTRGLTNGVHAIAWVVRDSMGRAEGIGSRYFTVANP